MEKKTWNVSRSTAGHRNFLLYFKRNLYQAKKWFRFITQETARNDKTAV